MRLLALTLLAAPALGLGAPARADDLRIISIDVEGGAATLYITPQGRSVLIDTGWPRGRGGPRSGPGGPPVPSSPASAERIVAAARAAGLTRLDHVIVTHYHIDHVGGFAELATLMPIGEVIDHGPNREPLPAGLSPAAAASAPATVYPQYVAARAGMKHRTMQAGQRLRIGGLELVAVHSDGVLAPPQPGAGAAGVGCDEPATMAENGGEENPRSLGLLLRWGKARIVSLADATWTLEHGLVCPRNRIGRADLMFADNHGSAVSNPPALAASLRPRVVVFNNGPTKGADGVVLERYKALPGVAVWQLHGATRTPAANTAPERIVNLDPFGNANLAITVSREARITIRNPRNGLSETYVP
ncbi:ComEC/Rec2 family competence protein [Novosphingobium piscinae]|uniref:MBL fold metallo-hydrolase n=1 Tax=Novosphingobium piscinae TaxID=1507448 RepID=A0A7X1FZF4_9SPHN|nr:MBL fold metallo-hydrolase [Novosphingobium piscinae]MBC2669766.1 MBL fold metallo-hydrolase [Novosphingobium piscinae]